MINDSVYKLVRSGPLDKYTTASKQQRRWRSQWIGDTWILESVCTVFGILLIIAICIVLRAYDGQPTPRFGSILGASLTLNTVVAILSTCANAVLILPVAECVSQLKWIYFEKNHRSLADIATFDNASRGLFGGVELLVKTKLRSIASIGALIMVITIAIEPLSQQLISYQVRQYPSVTGNATVGILTSWSETSSRLGVAEISQHRTTYNYISTGMTNAIQRAVYSENEPIPDLVPQCPGGNCTFEPYESLAVCSSYKDVSSHLVERKYHLNNSAFLPQWGYRIHVTEASYIERGSYFGVVSASTGAKDMDKYENQLDFDTIAFKGVQNPIADFYVIHATGYNDLSQYTYGAMEWVMEWCVQNYSTIVVNGAATTIKHNAVRTFSGITPSVHHSGRSYSVDPITHDSLQRYLVYILDGSTALTEGQIHTATSDAVQSLFRPYNVWTGDLYRDWPKGMRGTNETGFDLLVRNIGTSMSNHMRINHGASLPQGSANVAQGTIYHQDTIVVVRWGFVAAHVIYILLTVFLLAGSMLQQFLSPLRQAGAWKSSSLAVMHALEPTLQHRLGGISRNSIALSQDGREEVRLQKSSSNEWRLVSKQELEER